MNTIINKIDFDKQDGLVPVITQDATTNEILMLAYMNKEALELTHKQTMHITLVEVNKEFGKKGRVQTILKK